MNVDSSNDSLWDARLRPISGHLAGLVATSACDPELTLTGKVPYACS